jgi:hypothetical protein
LRYPSAWQFESGYGIKYAGPDGFFQISAIWGPGATIDEIADGDAHHKLQPYGTEPTIEALRVDGQPARLIMPSDDQPAAMAGQSGLIVELPQPIDLSGDTYNFLILWADEQHIRPIADTLSLQQPVTLTTPTLAVATAPGAVRSVLLALSRSFGVRSDDIQLLGYEYVSWPDGCLGVPMRGVCTQAVVPGFRILVRFQGQDYEYRTDLQGSRFVLSSAPDHGITQPALIWEGGEVCETLILDQNARAAVGPCDAPLRPAQLTLRSPRWQGWMDLSTRFSPFEAETPSGTVAFRGVGPESANAAWQRAIAAWAQLVHAELESGRSTLGWSLALRWQEELSERPGYCRTLEVHKHGFAMATLTLCEGRFTQILGDGWLTEVELDALDAWYYRHAALEAELLSFSGSGTIPVDAAVIGQLNSWSDALHSRLAGP